MGAGSFLWKEPPGRVPGNTGKPAAREGRAFGAPLRRQGRRVGKQRGSSKGRLAGIGVDHNGQGNGFPDNPVPRIIVMNLCPQRRRGLPQASPSRPPIAIGAPGHHPGVPSIRPFQGRGTSRQAGGGLAAPGLRFRSKPDARASGLHLPLTATKGAVHSAAPFLYSHPYLFMV